MELPQGPGAHTSRGKGSEQAVLKSQLQWTRVADFCLSYSASMSPALLESSPSMAMM